MFYLNCNLNSDFNMRFLLFRRTRYFLLTSWTVVMIWQPSRSAVNMEIVCARENSAHFSRFEVFHTHNTSIVLKECRGVGYRGWRSWDGRRDSRWFGCLKFLLKMLIGVYWDCLKFFQDLLISHGWKRFDNLLRSRSPSLSLNIYWEFQRWKKIEPSWHQLCLPPSAWPKANNLS